ncbi:hypothetical protein AYO21_05827 [Fonsecaea monophora]|uniref:RING-type domain-containing protein n=1 Tax=Fonsecaea monophora TaxID=254056 RepID=A0A177F6X0_9EURO|nr:hypothetical protein AYO21_05827 [Fonsecaea monophora]OAG39954.1 hypothetical protein AYO21_05827 [Fonsecaea monophora]
MDALVCVDTVDDVVSGIGPQYTVKARADAETKVVLSSIEAGWQVEDSSLPPTSVASQHRKRLKKLDQVAPAQSLLHWRAENTAICLESLEETDLIRELRCGHVYHANCLSLWVERGHHDCPLCKYDMLGLMKNFLKPHPDDDDDTVVAPDAVQEAGQPSGETHNEHTPDYGSISNNRTPEP